MSIIFLEKSKMIFFQTFSHGYIHFIVWNRFIVKFILILEKYLFRGCSKWWQTKNFSQLKQIFVIKFWVVDKCKLWVISTRMCDVYEETCLRRNYLDKLAKHGFVTTNLNWKHTPRNENTLYSKRTVLSSVVSNEHNNLPRLERTYHCWVFLKKV